MKLLFSIFFVILFNISFGQSSSLSVKNFGAKGNGLDDDSKAFQAALDHCNGNPGLILKIPSGKYLLTKQLLVKSSISVVGEQQAELIVDQKVPNNLLLFYENAVDIQLVKLIFSAVNNKNTPELIRFESVKNITISECSFLGLLPLGFNSCVNVNLFANIFKSNSSNPSGYCNFMSCSNVTISGNLFQSASGVQFINACKYLKILDNRFINIRNYPIHFDGQSKQPHLYVVIEDNTFRGSGAVALQGGSYDQISCFNVDRVQITNNQIQQGGDMGITLADSKNIYVAANNITGNSTSGISIINTKNCIIENNIIKDNGTRPNNTGIDPKARAGIYVYGEKNDNSSDSVVLSNNSIRFDNKKWQYYPVIVSSNPPAKHRIFFFKSEKYGSWNSFSTINLTNRQFSGWKKNLLSKIEF